MLDLPSFIRMSSARAQDLPTTSCRTAQLAAISGRLDGTRACMFCAVRARRNWTRSVLDVRQSEEETLF